MEKTQKNDTESANNERQQKNRVPVKGANLAIMDLEQKISRNIEESRLPVSVIRLVLSSFLLNIRNLEDVTVQNEMMAFENEKNNVNGKE